METLREIIPLIIFILMIVVPILVPFFVFMFKKKKSSLGPPSKDAFTKASQNSKKPVNWLEHPFSVKRNM